jgi:hypothetical protein
VPAAAAKNPVIAAGEKRLAVENTVKGIVHVVEMESLCCCPEPHIFVSVFQKAWCGRYGGRRRIVFPLIS